jgi:hypothetical protein
LVVEITLVFLRTSGDLEPDEAKAILKLSIIFSKFQPGGPKVSDVIVGLQAYNDITDD